ncbi:MAG: histidine phosphatase family protein [Desulfovibrio sp.]|nr:histidine phosphatase family protein [Desulfovibrio sp.]
MRLFIIRHGTILPRHGLLGQQDWPLAEQGRKEMTLLAQNIDAGLWESMTAIVSSDLTRCVESAKILQRFAPKELPLFLEPGFREINLGSFEGLQRHNLPKYVQGTYRMRGLFFESFVPPNGESVRMAKRRVFFTLKKWLKRTPSFCLLTHAGVMRILIAHELALPLNNFLQIPLTYSATWYINNEKGISF